MYGNEYSLPYAVPDSAISLTSGGDRTAILGEETSISCTVAQEVAGLSEHPILELFDNNGDLVTMMDDTTLTRSDSEISGLTHVTLMASFSSLSLSHAGQYSCRAVLSSPALDTPLVKTATVILSVKGESVHTCSIITRIIHTYTIAIVTFS